MKERRVIRGVTNQFQHSGPVHIVVDDGNFKDGWRVTAFYMAPMEPFHASAGGYDCYGVLATHPDAIPDDNVPNNVGWNWEDRRQIAWGSQAMFGSSSPDWLNGGLIDPSHVVIRDLYLGITSGSGAVSAVYFNYFIEIERVVLDDNQSIMALVQEKAAGA
jgi:hypothetical protein